MKGVSILFDETRKKRYVRIDFDVITRHREELVNELDRIVGEQRSGQELTPKKKGKTLSKRINKR
jgi:hypothetical protein